MWHFLYKNLRPFFQAPDQILNHIEVGVSVLDIGCGYGDLCVRIAQEKSPQHVTGVDHDVDKIQVAQSQNKNIPHLQFEMADVQTLKSIEQHTVLIIDVFHYFVYEDMMALLKKVCTSPAVYKVIVRDVIRAKHPAYYFNRFHEFVMTRTGRTKVAQPAGARSASSCRERTEGAPLLTREASNITHFTFLTRAQWYGVAQMFHMDIAIEKSGLPFYNDHLIVLTRPK